MLSLSIRGDAETTRRHRHAPAGIAVNTTAGTIQISLRYGGFRSRADRNAMSGMRRLTKFRSEKKGTVMTQAVNDPPSGEAPLDDVEKALLRRALGFRQEEIHTEDLCDKKTGEVLESVRRRTVVKEIAPDVRALLFWLKNRRPARWRERPPDPDETASLEFDEDDERL